VSDGGKCHTLVAGVSWHLHLAAACAAAAAAAAAGT